MVAQGSLTSTYISADPRWVGKQSSFRTPLRTTNVVMMSDSASHQTRKVDEYCSICMGKSSATTDSLKNVLSKAAAPNSKSNMTLAQLLRSASRKHQSHLFYSLRIDFRPCGIPPMTSNLNCSSSDANSGHNCCIFLSSNEGIKKLSLSSRLMFAINFRYLLSTAESPEVTPEANSEPTLASYCTVFVHIVRKIKVYIHRASVDGRIGGDAIDGDKKRQFDTIEALDLKIGERSITRTK